MKELSIVIPCYNEAKNLPYILNKVSEITAKAPFVEVILVDNGSSDETSDFFKDELESGKFHGIRPCYVPENKGYGFGILCGLKEARGTYLAWTHADMQTDPQDVLKAYDVIKRSPDPAHTVVKGDRQNRAFLDTFFTCGMSLISSALLKVRLSDINAQPKVFSRKFYEEMADAPYDFSLDLFFLYTAQTKGYRLKTVPVIFSKRLHGEAKGGGSLKTKWRLIKRTFAYILTLRERLNV